MQDAPWEFWIDVGGTFTDCFAKRPDGALKRHKLLSSGVTKGAVQAGSSRNEIIDPARSADPERFWNGCRLKLLGADGQVAAIAQVAAFDRAAGKLTLTEPLTVAPRTGQAYELSSGEESPVVAIRHLLGLAREQAIPPVTVRLGTTRGTNALITRRGAKTALVTTRGFADVLCIGYQNRPKLFELAIRKPRAAVRRGRRDRRADHAARRRARRARPCDSSRATRRAQAARRRVAGGLPAERLSRGRSTRDDCSGGSRRRF